MIHEKMESIEQLLPRILPQTLRCPKSMALDALQLTTGDFCKQTDVWTALLQEIVLVGKFHITLCPPKESVITSILRFWLDSHFVDKSDYTHSSHDIMLKFSPNRNALASAEVTLRPSREATSLPKDIMEEWGDILTFGALAKLKSMSGAGVEWSDPQGAAMNLELYNEGCCRAKTRMLRNRHGGGNLYAHCAR